VLVPATLACPAGPAAAAADSHPPAVIVAVSGNTANPSLLVLHLAAWQLN
jgi:hypothetical protein